MMASLRELVTELTFKVDKASLRIADRLTGRVDKSMGTLSNGIGRAERRFKAFLRLAQRNPIGTLFKVGGAVAGIGLVANALSDLGSKAKAFTEESLNMFANYERTLKTLQVLTKTTGKDFEALQKKADKLGASTKFTAQETGEVMVDLARRGYKATEILSLIDPILATAIANNSDLATSMDAVTGAMKAYGVEATEAAHFSDVLTVALNSSNMNIGDFIESMKNAAPAAKVGGQSIETLAVLTGILGEANIKGAEAGTKLRQTILRLTAPNKEQARVLDALGVKVADTTGKIRPMTDVISELRLAFAGLTQEQQLQTAKLLVGDEALTGFTALLSVSTQKQNELEAAQRSATGATKAQADEMSVGLLKAMEENESALDSLKTAWGRLTSPLFQAWISGTTKLFNGLTWAISKATENLSLFDSKKQGINKAAISGGVGFGIGASPYIPSQVQAQRQAAPRSGGAGGGASSKSFTNTANTTVNINGGSMTQGRARQLGESFASGSLRGFRVLENFGV